MTIKIIFEGIEIQVPTGEVANVMRELQELRRSANGTSPQRVPSQPTVEAAATTWPPSGRAAVLTRPSAQIPLNPSAAWPAGPVGPPTPQKPAIPARPPAPPTLSVSDFQYAALLLRTVSRADAEGMRLTGTEVAEILGVKHPKGIGSRAAGINRALESLGFDLNDVYRVPRDTLGMRYWTGGTRLDEALALLEREMDKTQG